MRASNFCHACGKVQPPMPVNYFSFFGLPRKLNLDTEHLERDFYELSRKLHPDLNARADAPKRHRRDEIAYLVRDFNAMAARLQDLSKSLGFPVSVWVRSPRKEAEVPIFILSTFETDYLLVREHDLHRSVEALTDAGYEVDG